MLIPSIIGGTASSVFNNMNGQFLVSSYSPYSDGTRDDAPAFIACIGACIAAGGGVVVVDVPIWLLGTADIPGGTWFGTSNGASNLLVMGLQDAAPITVYAPALNSLAFANWNILAFVDLVFIGGGNDVNAPYDCQHVFTGHSWQLFFERCSFLGLRTSGALLNCLGTTEIANCKFGGSWTDSGPGLISSPVGGKLTLRGTEIIDYGYSRGVIVPYRENSAYPWIYFRGNGSGNTPTSSTGQGISVHIYGNCYFDEGCTYVLDVAKLNPAGPPIRSIVIENTSGNSSVQLVEGFHISGVDSFVYRNGDWGWQNPTTMFRFRDTRSVELEHVYSSFGSAVDVDSTVTYLKMLECPNLTVTGSPGKLVHQFNGVDV